jgi:hypothetical protein
MGTYMVTDGCRSRRVTSVAGDCRLLLLSLADGLDGGGKLLTESRLAVSESGLMADM